MCPGQALLIILGCKWFLKLLTMSWAGMVVVSSDIRYSTFSIQGVFDSRNDFVGKMDSANTKFTKIILHIGNIWKQEHSMGYSRMFLISKIYCITGPRVCFEEKGKLSLFSWPETLCVIGPECGPAAWHGLFWDRVDHHVCLPGVPQLCVWDGHHEHVQQLQLHWGLQAIDAGVAVWIGCLALRS